MGRGQLVRYRVGGATRHEEVPSHSCRRARGTRPSPLQVDAARTTQVIVLNGGSSAGKSEISLSLQALLAERPWLRLSVDDLVDRLPPSLLGSGTDVAFGQQGEVVVGAGFQEMEAAWIAGVAAMARAGACVIFDDVFLGGAASQERARAALGDLNVL